MMRLAPHAHAGRLPAGSAVAVLVALLAFVAWPRQTAASCAATMSFEEAARLPNAAVFTGRAVREDAEFRVVFEVDRWFAGSHPARVVLFGDAMAGLVEAPEAGVIPAVLAATVSGEAISFVRDQPVIVTAVRTPGGEYDPVICTEAAVPLASPEGRAVVAQATALFGPGTAAARLPATATLPDGATAAGSSAPWLPAAAFVLAVAGALVVLRRRPGAAGSRAGTTRE